MVSGEGTLALDGSTVNFTLHYMPTNLAGAAVLDYVVEGAYRQEPDLQRYLKSRGEPATERASRIDK